MIRFDEATRSLILDNDLIHAEWRVGEQGAVTCKALRMSGDGVDWLDTAVRSPLYELAYRELAGTGRTVTVSSEDPHAVEGPEVSSLADGTVGEAVVRLLPTGTPLEVLWHLQCHPRHATLRQWFELTNKGETPIVITRLPVVTYALRPPAGSLRAYCGLGRERARRGMWADWYTWRWVELGPGVKDAVQSGYRREATWLGLVTPGGGPGMYVGWESNARATCAFGDMYGDGAVWVECCLRPGYRLEPGASLAGPPGFVGLAEGDLDELAYRCQRYVEDVLARRVEDPRFPYVAFNSWGYGPDIDEESMLRCLDVCQRLGVELFVVDFGWEDPDWRPLADRFPRGLAPLADAAHARGMLFGAHLSFGNASSLSQMYKLHPDWVNGPGQWAYRREGEVYAVTLGNPATREWMLDKLLQIIDDNKLDYFLTDHRLWGWCNPRVQPLHATNDYVTVVEGFDWLMDRLRELRPHVLIEHCDNGLSLPTFKIVRQHVTSIGADAAGALYERVHTWRISHVLPPRYLAHYVCDQPAPGRYVGAGLGDYEYRSHLLGGPMILMTHLHQLQEGSEEWRSLQRQIALYKRIRQRVARGKVLHLLEPQPLERVGHGWDGWDAIGSYDEVTDSAVIFVFCLGGEINCRTIPIHGLRADTLYKVSFEGDRASFSLSGRELMAKGLEVELPARGQRPVLDANGMVRASEVVLLEPADGPGWADDTGGGGG
ncbi:glycoside hydrolase family 36 protein [Thermobaculum terrenum]|uniref:glycoside hydrolase family 36 protein n=1 Tax=Thermobaculum terrenum TaxID=166501 RepID=UPI0003084D5F|nr:glycoside hydrolase family 36 protein [Thermobaculum terrenum]